MVLNLSTNEDSRSHEVAGVYKGFCERNGDKNDGRRK